jgi:hypothetical protein
MHKYIHGRTFPKLTERDEAEMTGMRLFAATVAIAADSSSEILPNNTSTACPHTERNKKENEKAHKCNVKSKTQQNKQPNKRKEGRKRMTPHQHERDIDVPYSS